MEKLQLIQEALERALAEGEKFYTKQNNSAGARLRKELQTIKVLCQEGRAEVTETKNERAAK